MFINIAAPPPTDINNVLMAVEDMEPNTPIVPTYFDTV
jgi:hypothetical protein